MSDIMQRHIDVAYRMGFEDGVRAYAHSRDGSQEVGTTGQTLEVALLNVRTTWNFRVPQMRDLVSPEPGEG